MVWLRVLRFCRGKSCKTTPMWFCTSLTVFGASSWIGVWLFKPRRTWSVALLPSLDWGIPASRPVKWSLLYFWLVPVVVILSRIPLWTHTNCISCFFWWRKRSGQPLAWLLLQMGSRRLKNCLRSLSSWIHNGFKKHSARKRLGSARFPYLRLLPVLSQSPCEAQTKIYSKWRNLTEALIR